MKRLLREPLVHFLAIGAALFLVFAWKGGPGGPEDRIVVTRARLDSLVAGFTRTWQRPPTPSETKGLVNGWVREEIAVRAAVAAGLDRDDPIVRRRLREKVESLAQAGAEFEPPAETALAADRRTRELDAFYARLLARSTVVVEAAPERR